MAIYKPSNFSPSFEEIDAGPDKSRDFSCMVNTSGEHVKYYKMYTYSQDGEELWKDTIAQVASKQYPWGETNYVKNKDELIIPINNFSTLGITNGDDYQWGVRLYNDISDTERPNTLITNGYIVGTTKNVIWCRIPANQKDVIAQIKTDENNNTDTDVERYICFENLTSSYMVLGAKDDPSKTLPSGSYTERQKINWVDIELGKDKDIVKIETVDPFTYNYIDGTAFKIYQCSDKHTVNSLFADPNSEVNITHFVIVYKTLSDAQAARTAGENPGNIVDTSKWADCMKRTNGNAGYEPRKITGYSSNTGEMRFHDAFSVPPVNGQYYRLFSYDVTTGYSSIDDDVITSGGTSSDPLNGHKVGGVAITNATYYKVLSNLAGSNTITRLFIQPNTNIKPDAKRTPGTAITDLNRDGAHPELVFNNGCRADIVKTTSIINSKEVDTTFDKLDNSQWLIESPNIRQYTNQTVGPFPLKDGKVAPQTPYSVYTSFADSLPNSIFYARETPTLQIQSRNYFKQEETSEEYVTWPDGSKVDPILYPSASEQKNIYYTDIQFNIIGWDSSIIGIKYYYYILSAWNIGTNSWDQIQISENYYTSELTWNFMGLETNNTYKIQYYIIDQYNKTFSDTYYFNVELNFEESKILPLNIGYDCKERAVTLSAITPLYAYSSDITDGGKNYHTIDSIEDDKAILRKDQVLNYDHYKNGDIIDDLFFPDKYTFLTRVKLTKDFISNCATNTRQDIPEIGKILEIQYGDDNKKLSLYLANPMCFYEDVEGKWKSNTHRGKLYWKDEDGQIVENAWKYTNGGIIRYEDGYDLPLALGLDYINNPQLHYALQLNSVDINDLTKGDMFIFVEDIGSDYIQEGVTINIDEGLLDEDNEHTLFKTYKEFEESEASIDYKWISNEQANTKSIVSEYGEPIFIIYMICDPNNAEHPVISDVSFIDYTRSIQ